MKQGGKFMTKSTSLIKEIPINTQPRERLYHYGEKALSDVELLAIIIRTGTKYLNVTQVALELLMTFQDLTSIKQASLEELQAIKGIGMTKAIEIKAAIELGHRIAIADAPKFGQITSTTHAGKWLIQHMKDFQQEHLVALFLNTKNEIIQQKTIFIGSVNAAISHPREIFKEAVKYPTARIIIAHNHPSGDTSPSQADLEFTKRLIECGNLMGIELLDHLIIGQKKFLSIREQTAIFD